jgi:hypothetical protein
MTTATVDKKNESSVSTSEKTESLKEVFLQEALLGLKLSEKGIKFDKDALKKFQDPLELSSGWNRREGITGFDLPHGVSARGKYSFYTPYSIVDEDNSPVLYDENKRIGVISFHKAHPVQESLLSTGEKVRDIASVNQQGGIHVMYSNECSLKDRGEDCLFCGFNERAKDGTASKVNLKTPRQVAEAYHLAREAGVGNHFRITGGFVPERREAEYYLDVADTIKEYHPSFYGVVVIGAPADLSIIHKYKEAGFSNISTNIEVWNRHIFAAMCPGKEKSNGGWQHWLDSLLYSVDVFGKGNVHTNLVGGLEPKDSILEGIEFLASKGVIAHFSAFRPEKGTPLEGYRSPEASWHWDLLDKGTDIFRRYGFTALQLYSGPASGPHSGEVFRIKEGDFEGNRLRHWKYPKID